MKKIKTDEKRIVKLYQNGESALTIQKITGINYRTIYRILERNGHKTRSHSEKTINARKLGRGDYSKQKELARKRWMGKKNPRWSGGWYIDKHSYKFVHDNKNRWRKEHRVVVEKIIGRDLERWETIHHINENKLDNRPENLYYFPNDSLHKRHHGLKNKPELKSNLITIR